MFRKAVIVSRLAPWPSDTGALLYTAMLVEQITRLAQKTILVVANHPRTFASTPEGITLSCAPAGKVSALRYLRAGLPFAALPFHTPDLRRRAAEALSDADLVVLDHIGSVWALDLALAAKSRGARLVHIAHNVESDTRRSAIAAGGARALFARFDAPRIERVEGVLLRRADSVICISADDRTRFSELGAKAELVVINPVHPGPAQFVNYSAVLPKRVVLVGSFHWRAKQENLWRFLVARSNNPAARAIALRVVGTMPGPFRSRVQTRFPDIEITGTVARIQDHLDGCRIGVIPEEEGGGFKLKALDYAYAGLPIFGLENGLRGLPLHSGLSMRDFRTMADLWNGIVEAIDDFPQLDALRHKALAAFEAHAGADYLAERLAYLVNGHGDV